MERGTTIPRLRLVAAVASLLLVGVLLVRTSSAAFNATTATSENSFTSGTLDLTNNEGASALFGDITDMVPGDAEERCLEVTYTGVDDPSAVKVHVNSYTDGSSFGDQLDVTVQEVDNCTDKTVDTTPYSAVALSSVPTDYGTASGSWTPTTTSESKGYVVTVELGSDTPNSFQGDAVSDLVFTWEVQAGTGSVS